MHTSALNVYAAGDVALAYNVTAGRRIPAEHWRDAAQQGLVAGLSTAGHPAAQSTCGAPQRLPACRPAGPVAHPDDDLAKLHPTPRGSVRCGSQMLSTRETAGPGTTIQLTDARELRASMVCSAEKPAVPKKVTSLRSRTRLRQFAPRWNT